jgi:hypothetical protein
MVGLHARGARHRSGVRAQERGAQARRLGVPGQAATTHASTCRKKDGSTRRPARKHVRLGAQRTTPRRGITRRASAAGCRSEVDLGAGVRMSTTSPHTLVCYTRTPRHESRSMWNPRHDAMRGTRHDARGVRWPSVRWSQVRLDASRTSAPGTTTWCCCVRG